MHSLIALLLGSPGHSSLQQQGIALWHTNRLPCYAEINGLQVCQLRGVAIPGSALCLHPCSFCRCFPGWLQMIKETMDKKFGAPWHVVAGGYFSYEITYEVHCSLHAWRVCQPATCICPCLLQTESLLHVGARKLMQRKPYIPNSPLCWMVQCKNILYLYVGGTTGVLLWKM